MSHPEEQVLNTAAFHKRQHELLASGYYVYQLDCSVRSLAVVGFAIPVGFTCRACGKLYTQHGNLSEVGDCRPRDRCACGAASPQCFTMGYSFGNTFYLEKDLPVPPTRSLLIQSDWHQNSPQEFERIAQIFGVEEAIFARYRALRGAGLYQHQFWGPVDLRKVNLSTIKTSDLRELNYAVTELDRQVLSERRDAWQLSEAAQTHLIRTRAGKYWAEIRRNQVRAKLAVQRLRSALAKRRNTKFAMALASYFDSLRRIEQLRELVFRYVG